MSFSNISSHFPKVEEKYFHPTTGKHCVRKMLRFDGKKLVLKVLEKAVLKTDLFKTNDKVYRVVNRGIEELNEVKFCKKKDKKKFKEIKAKFAAYNSLQQKAAKDAKNADKAHKKAETAKKAKDAQKLAEADKKAKEAEDAPIEGPQLPAQEPQDKPRGAIDGGALVDDQENEIFEIQLPVDINAGPADDDKVPDEQLDDHGLLQRALSFKESSGFEPWILRLRPTINPIDPTRRNKLLKFLQAARTEAIRLAKESAQVRPAQAPAVDAAQGAQPAAQAQAQVAQPAA
jgi:hypothetical protein